MRSFHFPGRSPVYGRRAMCATSHPAATLTAVETLRQGGNRKEEDEGQDRSHGVPPVMPRHCRTDRTVTDFGASVSET